MSDYTHNKAPKDSGLCKVIRRSINLDRKRQGFDWDDAAHELGMNGGTLENKLKPSMATSDMTVTELTHFMELSGDYAALEYLAKKFDMVLIPKKHESTKIADINVQVDLASMENNDVFRVVKVAIADDKLTPDEKENILKEIEEAEAANARLKDTVLSMAVEGK